jgi:hypothetical protein
MIDPMCTKCKQELKDFGGILLSPPTNLGMVKKDHLCQKCYHNVMKYICEAR